MVQAGLYQPICIDTVPVHSIVEHFFKSTGFQFPTQLPTFDLSQLSLSYTPSNKAFSFSGVITSDASVSIGVEKVSLKQLDFKIASVNKVTTGYIKGAAQTSFMTLTVAYDLAKGPIFEANFPDIHLNKLAEKLCGESLMQQIGLPTGFPDFHIKDCKLTLSLKDSSVRISANLDGYAGIMFELRKEAQKWGFVFAAMIGEKFRFQDIAGLLEPVDALNFKDSALVISTINAQQYTIPNSQLSGTLDKGLNFFMNLSLNKGDELLMVKKILHLHIDVLQIHMSVGTNRDALLEGVFGGEIQLSEGVQLTKTGLRLRLQSGIIKFSLFVTLKVDIDDGLTFTGEMTVEPTGAALAATMLGTWQKPFGVEGMSLSDIALAIGFNTAGIPTIGIAGKAKIQNLEGELAVLFNSKMPHQSALKLAFNELYVKSILALCDKSIIDTIPEPFEPVLESGYEDVEIYVVPTTTNIGELKYEQGFRAKGKSNILGWKSMLDMEIEPTKGITAKGMIDPINFLNVFEIKGAGGLDKPQMDIALRLDEQKALIAGELDFLGIQKQAIFAKIGSDGAKFSLSQKMYGAVELKLNDCSVSQKGFNAAGQIIFGISSIGPLKIAGKTIINKIDINTYIQMSGSIRIDSIFEFTFNGSLVLLGYSLPEIKIALSAAPKDFKEIWELVMEKVKTFVVENFTSIWKNIKEFALFIKDQLVNIGEDIADIAKDVYKATEEAAIEAYKIVKAGAKTIARGMKKAYNMTEEALTNAFRKAQFAAEEIGEALKDAYQMTAAGVNALFKKLGFVADDIAKTLKHVFNVAENKFVELFKDVKQTVNDIANGLKNVFKKTDLEVTILLKNAGFDINDISKAIVFAFSINPIALVAILTRSGFKIDDIGHTLKNGFNVTSDALARAFKNAGLPSTNIAMVMMNVYGLQAAAVISLLKAIGVPTDDIASVLKNVFNYTTDACASALRSIGVPLDEISSSLKSVYNVGAEGLAIVLKSLGYSASEIARVLSGVFGMADDGIAYILKVIGFNAGEIGAVLKNVFGYASDGVAAALKGIGYGAEAVGGALQTAFNFSKDQVGNILKGVGYAADALGQFGSAIADGAKKVWDKINPFKW